MTGPMTVRQLDDIAEALSDEHTGACEMQDYVIDLLAEVHRLRALLETTAT